MKLSLILVLIFACDLSYTNAQVVVTDSTKSNVGKAVKTEMRYDIGHGKTLVYSTPKKFAFITDLPKDAAGIVTTTFSKQSIKPLLVIAASTGVLLLADQNITDGVAEFSNNIHLSPDEKNKNVLVHVGGKDIALLRFPGNVNTAFYQIGQGFPSLLIGAGLYTYGKIHDDYRALSTSSQLAEAFILMGVSTQIVKELPEDKIQAKQQPQAESGIFYLLSPNIKNIRPTTMRFPSGHLATLMSSITIFSENYPEKRWIRPVGYTLTGLVGYAMINNKVHWASDYPLALGMGYLCAKQVVKHNRRVESSSTAKKRKGELDYTFNYINGAFTPGVTYKF